MKSIYKSVKYKSREELFIPFEGKVRSVLKKGDNFARGTSLFEVEKRKLLASYYLPEDLGVKSERARSFVKRIEGEYISKDDVIAEKTLSGGLLSKRILSGYDGIINLSNIKLGYVNILSELGLENVYSTFEGSVKDVSAGGGIIIETDVCEIPLFYTNIKTQGDFFGDLNVLSDGATIPSTNNLDKSLDGKIVFVGRFLYPQFAKELFKRGCKFILTNSMNYDELKSLDVPIGILTGFGNIYFDNLKKGVFDDFNGWKVFVSGDKKTVQFPVGLNNRISKLFEQNYYTDSIRKGDIVKSLDLETFGLIGEVLDFSEENRVVLLTQEGSTFSVPYDNIELYNEEFSIMKTMIF